MLKLLKSLLTGDAAHVRQTADHDRRQAQVAAAALLHEATRVDLDEHDRERATAAQALTELFGLTGEACAAILAEGSERARKLTSYYGPVACINRALSAPQRVQLLEQLWQVAYADGRLDAYEDHYVRKIGRLIHVPHTQIMLARNRARAAAVAAA